MPDLDIDDRSIAVGASTVTRTSRGAALNGGAEVNFVTSGERPNIGRYSVLEHLGEGAMGVVLAAYDPTLDRKVAIKLIHPSRSGDDRYLRRLKQEARALARLSHPNVVTVYEVGESAGQAFVAMEYVKGQDLRSWLRRRVSSATASDGNARRLSQET